MLKIEKFSRTLKAPVTEEDLAAVNALSRARLGMEDVYLFAVRACDDQPDRDYERFTRECLDGLAPLFLGKTVLFDHAWTITAQTARIYATAVISEDDCCYLQCKCYMLRRPETESLIAAIEGGIVKEVSVGCAVRKASCSICGELYSGCEHRRGAEYDGSVCIVELSEPTDAYELSFVAVPAQRAAGVEKHAAADCAGMTVEETDRAKARLNMEKIRFGG